MKRLLLVDDDANLLDSAKDILEDAGYHVQTAHNLAAARAVLAVGAIHILLVDFNLPDGKGTDLAQEVRASYPRVKIMLMTGEVPVAINAASATFDVVLTKPVDPATLLTLLSAFNTNADPPA